MSNDDGGSAFPTQHVEGMTLRDWLAGQALAGLVVLTNQGWRTQDAAARAYECADEMLKRRAK